VLLFQCWSPSGDPVGELGGQPVERGQFSTVVDRDAATYPAHLAPLKQQRARSWSSR
jgi:hypothetical protein